MFVKNVHNSETFQFATFPIFHLCQNHQKKLFASDYHVSPSAKKMSIKILFSFDVILYVYTLVHVIKFVYFCSHEWIYMLICSLKKIARLIPRILIRTQKLIII